MTDYFVCENSNHLIAGHFINTELVLDAITRSVHGKFNCITVNFDRAQHGIYSSTAHGDTPDTMIIYYQVLKLQLSSILIGTSAVRTRNLSIRSRAPCHLSYHPLTL